MATYKSSWKWLLGLLLVVVSAPEIQAALNEKEIAISASAPPEAPVNGPVPLVWTIKNNTNQDLVLVGAIPELLKVSSVGDNPSGWEARSSKVRGIAQGPIVVTRLAPGEEIQQTVYLHDIFSHAQPGSTSITLNASLAWRSDPTAYSAQKIDVSRQVKLSLISETQDAFDQRVRQLCEQLASTPNDKRLEGFRALLGINHPTLADVFMRASRDPALQSIADRLRSTAVDLAIRAGDQEPVVTTLVDSGGRYDRSIFKIWNGNGVKLSSDQTSRLLQANSPWIRLFAVVYLQQDGNRAFAALDSLHQEVIDLNLEIENARNGLSKANLE